MKLSLVIPTFNEKENIQELVEKINNEFKEHNIDGEVIVVDDNSPDGTGEILEKLKKDFSFLKVIHKKEKLGLSSAVLKGFSTAKGDILGVMDADLSHSPKYIHKMFDAIKNHDFVIGSRYIKGGGIKGWSGYRKLQSRLAVLLSRAFTNIRDPVSGFFMIKRKCIKYKQLGPEGFKILLELIIKADYENIKEIPIIFINRTKGKSKAGIKEVFCYISNIMNYIRYKRK